MRDYKRVLRKVNRDPTDIEALEMINDCERFFMNEIKMYSDIDGQTIMKAVKERIRNEKEGKSREFL